MSISFKKGDMFSEPSEALVNTVNCVGVMGKGVALEFKTRWPKNYQEYKALCARKVLRPGVIFTFENIQMFGATEPKYLINFPTKDHWKQKSKIDYVSSGLDALVIEVKKLGIKKITMPPLGCGNGGLDWNDVKPLIEEKLSLLNGVDIVIFEPSSETETPEFKGSDFPMTNERAILLKTLGDLEKYFDGAMDRLSLQKIAYFLQYLGVNMKLDFSKNIHGPYSEQLRKAYVSLEKYGMISGFTSGERLSKVTQTGYAIADDYLGNDALFETGVIERLDKMIQGYESSYGLELLSSVHWLAHKEKHFPVERIIEAMQQWNENKRSMFDETAIRAAYERLDTDGFLN